MPLARKWPQDVIAVTGVMGSGKTTVCKAFQKLGATVFSADDLAREVVAPGSPTLAKIVAAFGKEILDQNGALDRTKMRAIVFGDSAKRKQLETLTHPEIRKLAQQKFEAAKTKDGVMIYEVPLLFEAGLEKLGFKKIIVTTAPHSVIISRVAARDKITPEAAEKILAVQIPDEEKRRRADIVIDTSLPTNEIEAECAKLYASFSSSR